MRPHTGMTGHTWSPPHIRATPNEYSVTYWRTDRLERTGLLCVRHSKNYDNYVHALKIWALMHLAVVSRTLD